MTRKKLIVGNWKMHCNAQEASVLVHRLDKQIEHVPQDAEVVLCPSFLSLQPLAMQLNGRRFKLGAQNVYHKDEGAFTGEVSAHMLRELVDYAIVGHSERRTHFHEKEEIALKVSACFRNSITPILCVGETLIERQNEETKLVLHDQIMADLAMLTAEEVEQMVIAYEPVWAIGSGDFAKPEQVLRAIRTIRHNIAELFGKYTANKIKVLYGGSTNPDNAKAYLKVEGVDGLLVGGASLNYHQFADIIEAARDV